MKGYEKSTTGARLISSFLAMLLVLAAASPLSAESGDREESVLFVISTPLGASVALDGESLTDKTPLLIRQLDEGKHFLTISKEGYSDQKFDFNIEKGERKVVDLQLRRPGFDLYFPSERSVLFNDSEADSVGAVFGLEEGTYNVSRRNQTLRVQPRFPQQRWMDALHIAIPIFLGLTTYLTLDTILNPPDTDFSVPPAVLASHIMSATLIGVDIGLAVSKANYMRSFSVDMTSREESEMYAREQYEKGEELLAEGDLQNALLNYASITESHAKSKYYPYSLYKQAKIRYLLGEPSQALVGFQKIVTEYPLPEVYDKSQKNLADIYVEQGDFDKGIEHLNAMVFLDPFYTREDIDLFHGDILALELAESRNDESGKRSALSETIDWYEGMVEKYEFSENIDLYRYRLSLYLYEAGARDEALSQIEKIDRSSLSPEFEEKIQSLLQQFD
jgi:tetratricopeptide (TPR) repeat protein